MCDLIGKVVVPHAPEQRRGRGAEDSDLEHSLRRKEPGRLAGALSENRRGSPTHLAMEGNTDSVIPASDRACFPMFEGKR